MSMYKKIALLFSLLCTLPQYASCLTPWLEIKPSYFFFSESPMNEIYNHGCFKIQGSGSVLLNKYFGFYGSIGYQKASGRALNSGEKTSLSVVPVDIGVKLVLNSEQNFYSFFAIGPRYFSYNQHNSSSYIGCAIDGGGIGFFANTGFNFTLADCFLFGVFGEYSYEKTITYPSRPNVFSNGSVQIGGFAFGVSFGYKF